MSPAQMTKLRQYLIPICFTALVVATLVLSSVYPVYSNYDSIYSLVWSREILNGSMPSFDGYRAPTQHPLWILLGMPIAAFGDSASHAFAMLVMISYLALLAGVYRLAKATFNTTVAVVAAVLFLSRLDFIFLAIRGYVDIPYMALIFWAGALESEKPKRGGVVWILLILAGLLRPEAWVFSGIYFLWLWKGSDWNRRIKNALLCASAPLIWILSDFIVTGDPLYSMNYTTRSAEALNRQLPIGQLPIEIVRFLVNLLQPAVLLLGVIGLFLAFLIKRKDLLPLLVISAVSFLLYIYTCVRGFAAIERYLATFSITLMIFAALSLAGFSLLKKEGSVRKFWYGFSAFAVLVGGLWTATHFSPRWIEIELNFRTDIQRNLRTITTNPEVLAALKCGPATVPNHKLLPDIQWLLGNDAKVLARSDLPDFGRKRKGVAIFIQDRKKIMSSPGFTPFDQLQDSPLIQVPGDDFKRVVTTKYFSAYTSC